MKNILLIFRNVFPLVLIVFLLASCVKEEPIGVNQLSLHYPGAASAISRSELVPNSVGYANGNIRSDRATIKWTASVDPQFLCYKIFRDGSLLMTIPNISTTSYVDTTLFQDNYYLYTVATITNQGTSKVDTVTIKTAKFNLPALNFQVQLTPDTNVRIFWRRTIEVPGEYKLFKYSSITSKYELIKSTAETTFTDVDVVLYRNYRYMMSFMGTYEKTDSAYAPVQYFTYIMNYSPYLYEVYQLLPERKVRLSWSDNNNNGVSEYKIFRRKDVTGAFIYVSSVSTDVRSYIDADASALAPDFTYYYYIQGSNLRDSTPTSNTMSVRIIDMTKFIARWVKEPPASMATNNEYEVSWSINDSTTRTNVVWYGYSSGSSPVQKGKKGTYSAKLNFTYPGNYKIYARFIDTLYGYYHYTDTIDVVVGSSGVILNEGFESGYIQYPWYTDGNANWYASPINPYEGNYSARSGTISHSQHTYLYRTISFTGYKTISFRYRVSSESGDDYLAFYINNSYYNSWSGNTGWQYYSTSYYGYGTVILYWEYSKDGSGSSGLDAAFIDNVIVQ
ncbi:MAG: hypothetical protein QME52_04230 [Bacteroidota bacterium]|nr:hypothetical protein [Bacteroidota bacterium]